MGGIVQGGDVSTPGVGGYNMDNKVEKQTSNVLVTHTVRHPLLVEEKAEEVVVVSQTARSKLLLEEEDDDLVVVEK